MRHTLLTGVEVGRQLTDNFRNTGFFNNTALSILLPFDDPHPLTTTPVTFRQSATDADNHLRTNVAAAYAQDQLELSRHFQLVGGLRFDRFDLQYHNNRNGDTLTRPDNLLSPRAGLVFKPIAPLSVYTTYSVSYLPSSGDQFSSLTVITQQVEPEKFNNYEAGVKWGLSSGLELTTAVYRLDRTNTRSTDPNDPTRIVQTGSQRTNGYELGLNGRLMAAWTVAGGYAYQDAFVSSATVAARAGAQVGQVPHHVLSLWNSYQLHPRVRAALGVLHRSDMFAAIDNTVTLPGYTRADAAAYLSLSRQLRLQVNVENLFDTVYYGVRRQQYEHLAGVSTDRSDWRDDDLLYPSPLPGGGSGAVAPLMLPTMLGWVVQWKLPAVTALAGLEAPGARFPKSTEKSSMTMRWKTVSLFWKITCSALVFAMGLGT